MKDRIKEFILKNWDSCIKYNMQDCDTFIGLPYPYTVPAVGHFDNLYYWDTYFTNKGLEQCSRYELAKSNVDNMLYMVKKYGFMPNGNRTFFMSRSQPPFLSIMVYDVYRYYKDLAWLTGAYEILKIEYEFWINNRTAEIGLAHYGDNGNIPDMDSVANEVEKRLDTKFNVSNEQLAKHFTAVCESGWDNNPRWGTECYNYVNIELNSLLYMFEINMAHFAEALDKCADVKIWNEKAALRKKLMLKYMLKDNLFVDYNFVSKKQGEILSAAIFYPLFAGLADENQAKEVKNSLPKLETEWGILTCEQTEQNVNYQWDYPNGWACLQYIAIIGLSNYGYYEDAKRIAKKYTALVEKVFGETGNLWEKYNVVEGNINIKADGKPRDVLKGDKLMPAMMGWSAGVYLAALKYLEE